MKLKILHITQFLGVGGLEKVLDLLMEEQNAEGHDVELVVYDYEQSWVENFKDKGYSVDNHYQKKEGYDIELLKFLSKKIQNFDIIHTHDLNPALYISPLKLYFKLLDKKFPYFIHTAHGMDHIKKRPITKFYEFLVTLFSDKIVGVSNSVCDEYRKIGGTEDKIVLIENGTRVNKPLIDKVEAKQKLSKELNISPNQSLWGAVARIVPLKNQELILKLALELPDVNFLLIGPSGNDDYWKKLERNKPQNVFMLGAREDIPFLLTAIDVFVSASTHEGIPLSVLEAGAYGLPCLLSDIPGHKTLQSNSHHEVAHFFQNDNLEDMKKQATSILKNERPQTGINLFELVKRNYSSKAMYQSYLKTYMGRYV